MIHIVKIGTEEYAVEEAGVAYIKAQEDTSPPYKTFELITMDALEKLYAAKKKSKSFEDWRSKGHFVLLSPDLHNMSDGMMPGRIYPLNYFILYRGGAYELYLSNNEYRGDLLTLEKILFQYAIDEGMRPA